MIGIEGASFPCAAAGGTALSESPMKLPLRRPLTAAAVLVALGATAPNVATGLTAEAVTSAPSAATSTAISTATAHHARVLGHHGVGALKLGDSAREARAAGAHLQGRPKVGCRGVDLPARSSRPHRVDGYLMPKTGVVALFARPDMRTPEGVRFGSTLRAVKKAYPDLSKNDDGFRTVDLGGHLRYEFGIGQDRVVGSIAIVDDRQLCFD